jgi:hypothetical protein
MIDGRRRRRRSSGLGDGAGCEGVESLAFLGDHDHVSPDSYHLIYPARCSRAARNNLSEEFNTDTIAYLIEKCSRNKFLPRGVGGGGRLNARKHAFL